MPNPTLAAGDPVTYTDPGGVDRDAICLYADGNTGVFVYAKGEDSTHGAFLAQGARLNQSDPFSPTNNTWFWPEA